MRPSASKNFYLWFTVEKIRAFAVFYEKYLQLCGWIGSYVKAETHCANRKTEKKCCHSNPNRWSTNLAWNKINVFSLSLLQLTRLVINCWLLQLLSQKSLENDTYIWLSFSRNSISQTQLYLKQIIRSLDHLTLCQSKNLSVSRFSLSQVFAYAEQIFRSLQQFFRVISNFSKTFCKFSTQISHFSAATGAVAGIVPVGMSKAPQIDFFYIFMVECFDSIFWSLK